MVYVLVATYSEPASLVRECVLRLLAAPEPLDLEKLIVVCDDGHALAEGAHKKALVESLNALGATLWLALGGPIVSGALVPSLSLLYVVCMTLWALLDSTGACNGLLLLQVTTMTCMLAIASNEVC